MSTNTKKLAINTKYRRRKKQEQEQKKQQLKQFIRKCLTEMLWQFISNYVGLKGFFSHTFFLITFQWDTAVFLVSSGGQCGDKQNMKNSTLGVQHL